MNYKICPDCGMEMSINEPSCGGRPHLHVSASYLKCSKCGRKSWGGTEINSVCAMPQPNGEKCSGIMEGIKGSLI